ncbi:MAG: bifunctional aminoglycoside phosphotransferase/ATP-binding protein [Thermodesulfobacteriota bacterium]|nr:MAG: bifunctional aminoglycoside phosphotransferase/ATP-binding protein [Thermodesulfobacteriota bacterium]
MGLPRYIEALLSPRAYPEGPRSVELRQTHISYLFFTPEFVYKVKKPVDFGFLDFTTLEKRKKYCAEEVRLNRRLAADVYMGVVSVTEKDGLVSIDGEGGEVDCAVKMKRLKTDTMLDEMIKSGRVTEDIIRRVAERIFLFHKDAATDTRISTFGSPDVIRKNTGENFSQTENFKGELISEGAYSGIKSYTEGFIDCHTALFEKRVRDGFIRDCHGDIHTEHISIEDSINIIDCIEFNERFRFSDIVSDMAFLSMDLDFLNRSDLSRIFVNTYFSLSGRDEGGKLLDFYKGYRAFVRAKVEGFKYLEPEVGEEERKDALIDALHHFHLAGLYARGGFKPQLIIVCGLSGTGKSAIARAIAESSRAVRISSDNIRKDMAGVPARRQRPEPFGKGIYSRKFTEKTYERLISTGVGLLRAGRSTVLDATFSRNIFIEKAVKEALKAGVPAGLIRIIECTAPDDVIRARLLERPRGPLPQGEALPDMTWEIFGLQKASYEKKTIKRLVLDGTKSLENNAIEAIKWVFSTEEKSDG